MVCANRKHQCAVTILARRDTFHQIRTHPQILPNQSNPYIGFKVELLHDVFEKICQRQFRCLSLWLFYIGGFFQTGVNLTMVCWPRNINAHQCYGNISLAFCIFESVRQDFYFSSIFFQILLQELPLGRIRIAHSFGIQQTANFTAAAF